MTGWRVLVVDDEIGMLEVCRDTLCTVDGVEIDVESRSECAVKKLEERSWDLLIADIRMPGVNGLELLEVARRQDPQLPVLMMTAYPTVDTAVESMKRGAADYIVKPFLPDDLRATARRLLAERRLRDENELLSESLERRYAFGDIVGGSMAMRAVFDAIERVAATDVDVLVTGETGTGKELVARSVHQRSRRKQGHFVPVDCGAIPADLLESEFFGHERGAFTGANSRRLGLVEFAARGTLFLDEIDHLPASLQSTLLRALQERRIRRVGGSEELDVDVRVIAATSANLEEEIRKQTFRSDLYYRINVVRIELPPLRRRPDDIPPLVAHFIERYAREIGRDGVEIDREALEVLTGYAWPGNVRELQNVIKRVLVFSRRPIIRADDLPDEIVAGAGSHSTDNQGFFALREQHSDAFERSYFEQLLRAHGGDVAAAAAEAKLPRGTLYRLLKKHGISLSEHRS
ncbi:MAG TPA: sigma-54 dependent transcriptional regulator [Gemmatimonadaceae bacterium]|nr:sigma-54 dependent transcriptional regulator [Gemmatimonadaceae bacterium]